MNAHVPEPLRDAKTQPLNTESVPPEKVAEYLKQLGERAQDPSGAAKPQERVEITPDPIAFQEAPGDIQLTEALVDERQIVVTEEDKAIFLKALLTEVPVRLRVVMFNGQLKVDCRSRFSHEQKRIFDVLRKDMDDGLIPKDDTNLFITRMQDYTLALMIERINDESFSELALKPGSSLEEDVATLRAIVKTKLEPMVGIRRSAIINAMRIFETKCAKMSTEAANEDFWKPRG